MRKHHDALAKRSFDLAAHALVGIVALLIAPVAGAVVGGSMPNPPGNGPGAWQLVVGGLVPFALVLIAARRGVRLAWLASTAWAVASMVVTASLVLLLIATVDFS